MQHFKDGHWMNFTTLDSVYVLIKTVMRTLNTGTLFAIEVEE